MHIGAPTEVSDFWAGTGQRSRKQEPARTRQPTRSTRSLEQASTTAHTGGKFHSKWHSSNPFICFVNSVYEICDHTKELKVC
jgi:hypothetical protein